MHARVEKLPRPQPDYRRLLQAVRCARPDRVPLIELAVHPEVVAALLDEPVPTESTAVLKQSIRAHHRLGYDVIKVAAPHPWKIGRLEAHDSSELSRGARTWTDEHAGPIGNREEFDRHPWPKPSDVDFGLLERATAILPDGMKIVGFSGGVLEFAMDLMGMERLMLALRRDPELVADVIERVGGMILSVFETYCQMDAVCAIWLGDDLGHKHGLLVSPKFLKEHVFPWYRRFAELAHAQDMPFILHSCGNTADVMPTLVEDVGINAKHSFEDGIEPVERFIDRWAGRIGILGGVDVHLLSTGDEQAIRRRTLEILAHAAPHGGYACGSGNSIPNYVSPERYIAMVEAVAAFNRQ